jgi:hypothetical protein
MRNLRREELDEPILRNLGHSILAVETRPRAGMYLPKAAKSTKYAPMIQHPSAVFPWNDTPQ